MKNNGKKKNNLDERQEQELLKIEHNGFWTAFVCMCISSLIALVFSDDMLTRLLCHIPLLIVSVYISVACLEHGIWDRRLKPTRGTNLLISVIAAVIVSGCTVAVFWVRIGGGVNMMKYIVILAAVMFVVTLLLTYIALSILAKAYRNKVKELEDDAEKQDSEQ